MKARNGFVSNSSSSSFIIGAGVVSNYEKFMKWYNNVDRAGMLYLVDSSKKIDNYWLESRIRDMAVTAPVNEHIEISVSKEDIKKCRESLDKKSKTKMILSDSSFDLVFMYIGNDEGDSAFYEDENDYELDYDISLDFFPKIQREIYEGFCEQNGISFIDKRYGASRNG